MKVFLRQLAIDRLEATAARKAAQRRSASAREYAARVALLQAQPAAGAMAFVRWKAALDSLHEVEGL